MFIGRTINSLPWPYPQWLCSPHSFRHLCSPFPTKHSTSCIRIRICLIINRFIGHSRFWKVYNRSSGQEIRNILWNSSGHCCIRKSSPRETIPSSWVQSPLIHTSSTYLHACSLLSQCPHSYFRIS
jgi:hypothetical protein